MLSYLEFVNENRTSLDLKDLLKTLDEISDATSAKKFSVIAAQYKFYNQSDYLTEEIDKDYANFKKLLEEKGFTLGMVEQIYAKNKKFLDENPMDYSDVGYVYNGMIDILFYEASKGSFILGGHDLKDKRDLLVKYDYGWHNHKYGKMAIDQHFSSVEELQKFMMTNAYKDEIMSNLGVLDDIEKINEYYFIIDDRYAHQYFKNDCFYVYDIGSVHHIISYKEGVAGDIENFTKIILKAYDYYGGNEFMEWLTDKQHKFPKAVDEFLTDDKKLNTLLRTGKGLKKYNII
jgi:hypothetical protein